MTTSEIANRLKQLCQMGEFETAQKELYADDVISIEPYATPAFDKETKGLEAVLAKGEKFEGMVEEYHSIEVSDPLIASNAFTFVLNLDITMKGQGRMNMTELCVYVVKDGKIVKEEFYM